MLRRTVTARGPTMATTSTFAANKKQAYGRVNTRNLFSYNKDKPVDAMKERTYWEVNKDVHPINRWWWLRWSKKIRSESLFTERVNSFPVDQRYKLKKILLAPSKATLILPVMMSCYIVYCYIRHKFFGTTPRDASVGTNRFMAMMPRFPGTAPE